MDTIIWLISLIVAFVGVAVSLLYQGEALGEPQAKQRMIGRKMRIVGFCWIGIAFFLIIIIVILTKVGLV